jgi:hypothetical protein
MRLLFIFITLFTGSHVFAQSTVANNGIFVSAYGDVFIHYPRKSMNYNSNLVEQSSPYFNEKASSGEVFLNDKTSRSFAQLKLNVNNHTLEVSDNNRESYFLPDMVKGFFFTENGSITNTFLTIKTAGNNNAYFMEVASAGKVNLFLKYTMKLIKGTYNAALSTGSPDKILIKPVVYTGPVNGTTEVQLSKKSILPLFIDKSKQIEEFAASRKLKYSKLADVIEIANYYNSLGN